MLKQGFIVVGVPFVWDSMGDIFITRRNSLRLTWILYMKTMEEDCGRRDYRLFENEENSS